jgi:hypothetical protein
MTKPTMLRCKIDVTKILKEHLFQGKNGAKYLDCTLIPSTNSQYGDSHFIVQDLPKELRVSGKKGPIIGNAKTLDFGGPPKPTQFNQAPEQDSGSDEDVNF